MIPSASKCYSARAASKRAGSSSPRRSSEARRHAHFKRWGYDSFEDYTKRELHLRQETVDKLTGSFMFLKKRAPEVLTRDGLSHTIPSYQAVDFLRRAEAEENAPEEAVEAIRQRVIEEGAALPSIVRQFKNVVFPVDARTQKERDTSNLLNVAKRLRELLGETNVVPKRLASELGENLDRLLDSLSAAA